MSQKDISFWENPLPFISFFHVSDVHIFSDFIIYDIKRQESQSETWKIHTNVIQLICCTMLAWRPPSLCPSSACFPSFRSGTVAYPRLHILGTWSDPIPKVPNAWEACLNNGCNCQGTQTSNSHGEPVQYPWCGSERCSKLVCSHLLSLLHWCPAVLSLAARPFIQILAQHRWLCNWPHLNSHNWAPYAD